MKYYNYTITLTKPIYPRILADILSNTSLKKYLVKIKDNQFKGHIYKNTYKITDTNG